MLFFKNVCFGLSIWNPIHPLSPFNPVHHRHYRPQTSPQPKPLPPEQSETKNKNSCNQFFQDYEQCKRNLTEDPHGQCDELFEKYRKCLNQTIPQ